MKAEVFRVGATTGLELVVSAGKSGCTARTCKSTVPANCGACEFAFSLVPELGLYVCDKDDEPINLSLLRKDCPLKQVSLMPVCNQCGRDSWRWDFVQLHRTCKGCALVVSIAGKRRGVCSDEVMDTERRLK